jgi:hypothetical protein
MLRQKGKSIAVLMLILVSLSCARLPETGPIESDELEVLLGVKPVPAAWGNLISVTDKGGPRFQLWFQDDQGTVRMVGYDVRYRSLVPEVALIPRQ